MKLTEFLSLFKQGKVTAASHMKNLLEMAMADGNYDETEDDYLRQLAKKHKISEKKLESIRNSTDSIEFVLPEKANERFEQFYELVKMMVVDNDIDRQELRLCEIFAKKFEYPEDKAGELVNSVASNIQNGQTIKETKKRVNWLL